MKFLATGRDYSSGKPIELVFEADDAQTAFTSAQRRGIVVESINPITSAISDPRDAGRKSDSHRLNVAPKRRFISVWRLFVIALLVAVIRYGFIESKRAEEKFQRDEAARKVAEAEKAKLVAADNAEVDVLMLEVKARMDASDLPGASARLSQLLALPHATNTTAAYRLRSSIALSRDSSAVRTLLIELDDEEFNAFAASLNTPRILDRGYPVLNNAILAIARPLVPSVKLERATLAKKEAEEAAARRKQQLADAEAARKAQEQQAAATEAAKAAAQKEVQDKLDTFTALLKLDDFTSEVVDQVSVGRREGAWTATITVKNVWHIRNKQLRLQDTQNLWKAWALIASKDDLDSARIKIVDRNGNEVGGSRILAGSLIWVQD